MDPNVIISREESNEFDDAQSLGHVLIKSLSETPDKILLVSGITSEELTAKELLDRSILVAKSLIAAGLKPGDVVSIASENRLEFAYILCGTILLNCTFAPINLTYTEREMHHAFSLSKPKIIFMSQFASEKVVNVGKTLSYVKKLVLIDDQNPFGSHVELFNDLMESKATQNASFSPMKIDKSKAVSMILCSSGTTGLPKGVQLSQANLIAVARFSKNTAVKLGSLQFDEEPVILGLIPWFHAYGATTLIGIILSTSARVVLLPKFEEGLFLGTLENYKCNVVFVVPPLMVFLAKHPIVDDYDLSCLRTLVCGGAPLSKELELAVFNRLKIPDLKIHQGYGMSEMSCSVLVQLTMFKPGSAGQVVEGMMAKVIDESGKSVGPNVQGELCFQGNQNMLGYINDEKATNATIDKDGWLHTGDVAYYDNDKQFFIVDRIKELIKWKGFQVPPAEIEAILLTNPKIRDAAVIGIPDESVGELPMAFVVKADSVDLTADEVIEFVGKQVSPPKRLHGGVRFIDEIPKNLSGKILRRELRELVKIKPKL